MNPCNLMKESQENIFDTIKRDSEKTLHGEKTNKDEQV
jgi:hypothetical protein